MSAGLIRAGDSWRGAVVRATWAVRKERYGPTGYTADGLARVLAAIGRRGGRPRAVACLRGHRYTAENTYVDPRGKRHCRACGLVQRHRQRWAHLQRTKRARLKQAMLAAHPDVGGTARQFIAARRRYLQALQGKAAP